MKHRFQPPRMLPLPSHDPRDIAIFFFLHFFTQKQPHSSTHDYGLFVSICHLLSHSHRSSNTHFTNRGPFLCHSDINCTIRFLSLAAMGHKWPQTHTPVAKLMLCPRITNNLR
jgi:hypothetical protein